MLEQLDLAQGAFGQDLLAKDIGDLLDGDALVCLVVDGGAGVGGEVWSATKHLKLDVEMR